MELAGARYNGIDPQSPGNDTLSFNKVITVVVKGLVQKFTSSHNMN